MLHGLSIIIVNYKSAGLVIDCLHSFTTQISIERWEVIVVDNFSNDNSEELIIEIFPSANYIQMEYNAGFSRANNRGINASIYDTVLLLNADTIIENDSISKCYLSLIESRYVACGVQLLNFDRSNQVSGSYVTKGGLNYLLLLPYLRSVFKLAAKLTNFRKPSVEKASELQEVDWINGAFLMFKKPVIQNAGLLDEDFFLYMEEIEWCGRIKKHGRLCLFGNIKIIHLQGVTTKQHFQSKNNGYQNLSDKMGRQLMLSIWVRQRKQFGLAWFLFLFLTYGIEVPIFLLLLSISKLFGYKNYSFKDFTGYVNNYYHNTKFLISIIKNKPNFYKVI